MSLKKTLSTVHIHILNVFRIVVFIGMFGAILSSQWLTSVLGVLLILVTYIPFFIRKNMNVVVPLEFEIAVILFFYGTLYLGEMHDYYFKFWWWDLLLHALSGLLLGMIGFFLVYLFNSEKSVKLRMSPEFIALFSFCFALSMGVLWEFFEFSVDRVFSTAMQKSGLVDTMSDLIVDAVSASLMSILGLAYLKGMRRFFIINAVVERFVRKNPRLFQRRM